jgi:hypothetical protein
MDRATERDGGGEGGGADEMRDGGSSLVSTGDYWEELPPEEQQHWLTLGWDAASWSNPPPPTHPTRTLSSVNPKLCTVNPKPYAGRRRCARTQTTTANNQTDF